MTDTNAHIIYLAEGNTSETVANTGTVSSDLTFANGLVKPSNSNIVTIGGSLVQDTTVEQNDFSIHFKGEGTFNIGDAKGNSRLNVDGDIEILGSGNGVIQTSPDNTRFRTSYTDYGALITEEVD